MAIAMTALRVISRNRKLRGAPGSILAYLVPLADQDGRITAVPKEAEIIADCGVAKATVYQSLAALEREGVIAWERSSGGKSPPPVIRIITPADPQ